MSARYDYPVPFAGEQYESMCDEIDRLRISVPAAEKHRLQRDNDRFKAALKQARTIVRSKDAEIEKLQARESQLDAQIEVLEIVISQLRCVCDAAFTMVREDGQERAEATTALIIALEDARYEPRVDCDGTDCERHGAVIVHRPMCERWEP